MLDWSHMYHLYKQTRIYAGEPYSGPTSDEKPAEYKSLEEAIIAKKEFTERNPVGWNIYNGDTGELVIGFDYHQITRG
jgi:hypothetical protein